MPGVGSGPPVPGAGYGGVPGVVLGPPVPGTGYGALGCVRLSCGDRKSTRLNSSNANISYAVFCLKKKNCMTTAAQPSAISSDQLSSTTPSRRNRKVTDIVLFFLNKTATTEISPLSLPDALPI